MVKSILFVGVGGQGTILTSKILVEGLVELGYDVKMSEIHGMSQRGGSVVTQIRYGDSVSTPNVGEGEADLIVAFEKIEALRYLSYLKREGTMIMDVHEIYPMTVLTGAEAYPHDAIEQLKSAGVNVEVIRAAQIAEELGSPRSQNIVLLGALIRSLGFEKVDWPAFISKNVPEKTRETNIKAFYAGLAR